MQSFDSSVLGQCWVFKEIFEEGGGGREELVQYTWEVLSIRTKFKKIDEWMDGWMGEWMGEWVGGGGWGGGGWI